jgi:hypothetical protein
VILNYISTTKFGKTVYPFMKWNDALTGYLIVAVAVFTVFLVFIFKYLTIFKLKMTGS